MKTLSGPFVAMLCGLFFATAGITSWTLYRETLRQDCGLVETQARAMVIEDLRARGLPAHGLDPAAEAGPCRFDYRYAGDGLAIDYAVHADWRQGVTLAHRDSSGR